MYGRYNSRDLHTSWGSDAVSAVSGSHVPEKVEWDIQENGVRELEIIRKETERLETLFAHRTQQGPPGLDVSLVSLDNCTGLNPARLKQRRTHTDGSSTEAVLRAQVKMSQKLRAENSHLSAKRYILDAWNRARNDDNISDSCLFEVARAVVDSGYLDDNPQELARVMECAVFATKNERENSPFVDRQGTRTPDSMGRHSVLHPETVCSDSGSVVAVADEEEDMDWEKRGKQLQALVSMGIRLSNLHSAPTQIAQGRRFLADALHIAHEYPGVNNAATWELINFLVGQVTI